MPTTSLSSFIFDPDCPSRCHVSASSDPAANLDFLVLEPSRPPSPSIAVTGQRQGPRLELESLESFMLFQNNPIISRGVDFFISRRQHPLRPALSRFSDPSEKSIHSSLPPLLPPPPPRPRPRPPMDSLLKVAVDDEPASDITMGATVFILVAALVRPQGLPPPLVSRVCASLWINPPPPPVPPSCGVGLVL